jgi:hypothetical protein
MNNTGRGIYVIGIHDLAVPREDPEDIICAAVLLFVKCVDP